MANPGLVSNFNDALLTHFRLKTKILLVIFVVALGMQICTLTYVLLGTDLVGTLVPRPVVIIAPFTLIAMIVAEYLSLRFIDQAKQNGSGLKNFPAYLVTFFEVSFPTIVMAIAAYFTTATTLMSPLQLVNSPLIVVYFF